MSRETSAWLNANTLIGFCETDGNAWHWDGITPNQYPGPIPIEDIKTKLFNWKAELRTPYIRLDDASDDQWGVEDESTRAVVRIIDGRPVVFNYVSTSYAIHQYDEWLLENVATLVDESSGQLHFGSAILLRNGAIAAVQVRPSQFVSIGGDEMLPYILATTSHDSSNATTYKGCYGRVVCDNTLDTVLGGRRSAYRVKHTRGSALAIAEARQALDIIFTGMGEFEKEVERLMNTPINMNHLTGAIKEVWPVPEPHYEDGNLTNGRAITNWDRRYSEIVNLYENDQRAAPYTGTAWGGYMAFNTWSQWGVAERDSNDRDTADVKMSQLVGSLTGEIGTTDRKFLSALAGQMA